MTDEKKPVVTERPIDGLVGLHMLPTGTNAEKMEAAKHAIAYYEAHGLDWIHVVTFLIAWDHTARGCPFCGRRCF
jgi:hypothetical protein